MCPSQAKNILFPIHFRCDVGNCSSIVPYKIRRNLTSPNTLAFTDRVVLILIFRTFSFRAARLACRLIFMRHIAGVKMRREQKNVLA